MVYKCGGFVDTSGPTATILGTAADDIQLVSVVISLDGATPVPVTGLETWSSILTGLVPGDHTVVVTATDSSGQTATDSETFTITTASPVTITSIIRDFAAACPDGCVPPKSITSLSLMKTNVSSSAPLIAKNCPDWYTNVAFDSIVK